MHGVKGVQGVKGLHGVKGVQSTIIFNFPSFHLLSIVRPGRVTFLVLHCIPFTLSFFVLRFLLKKYGFMKLGFEYSADMSTSNGLSSLSEF